MGKRTEGVHELIETANLPTQFFRCHLTAEHGHHNTTSTKTESGYDSCDIEGGSRMGVDGLDDDTDDEDG